MRSEWEGFGELCWKWLVLWRLELQKIMLFCAFLQRMGIEGRGTAEADSLTGVTDIKTKARADRLLWSPTLAVKKAERVGYPEPHVDSSDPRHPPNVQVLCGHAGRPKVVA